MGSRVWVRVWARVWVRVWVRVWARVRLGVTPYVEVVATRLDEWPPRLGLLQLHETGGAQEHRGLRAKVERRRRRVDKLPCLGRQLGGRGRGRGHFSREGVLAGAAPRKEHALCCGR